MVSIISMFIKVMQKIKTIFLNICTALLKNETPVKISLLVFEIFDVKKRP